MNSTPSTLSFSEAVKYWLKLGFISFGGPAGQIAMMHRELVEKRRWISEHRFLHALNYCMILPGPEAQQLATYIGWLMHGVRGGVVAGVLFVLPSLFILIALSWIYMAYSDTKVVEYVLYGVQPAVVAVVAFAAYRIGSRALHNKVMWALAAAAFIAIFLIPFPLVVLLAAMIGFVGSKKAPHLFQTGGGHGASNKSYGPAIIDDHSPLPAWATYDRSRLISFVVIGVTIWLAAMAVILWFSDLHSTPMDMGWFFTKAAMLTFGGAYAVLPYVSDSAVNHYTWLNHSQMIAGFALGESTPGPLIMIVAYVGFVGAWTKAILGPDSLVLAGIIGACIATFFTFLPSFIFILVGAPIIEATRHDIKYSAPLVAITAAVVGVILYLAVYFANQIYFPVGKGVQPGWFAGKFDWVAPVITAAIFVLLYRFKFQIMSVIGISALLGLLKFVF